MEVMAKTILEHLRSLGVPVKRIVYAKASPSSEEWLKRESKHLDGKLIDVYGLEDDRSVLEAEIAYQEKNLDKMKGTIEISVPLVVDGFDLKIGRHGVLHITNYGEGFRYDVDHIAQRNIKKVERTMKNLSIKSIDVD